MVALSKSKTVAQSCGMTLTPNSESVSWHGWWRDLHTLITGKAAEADAEVELWAEETARSRRAVAELQTCADRGPEGAAWLLNEHAGHDGVQDPAQPPQTHFEVRRRLQKRWIEELRTGGVQDQDDFVKHRASQVSDASRMDTLDLQVEVTLQALVRGELPGINKTFDAGDTGGSGDMPPEAPYQLLPIDWVRLSEAYQVDFVLHGLPGTEGQLCRRCGSAGHIHTGSEASGGNHLCLHVGYTSGGLWEPLGAGPISSSSAAAENGSLTSQDANGSAATLTATAEAHERTTKPSLPASDSECTVPPPAGWEKCVRVFGDPSGLAGGSACSAACKAVCTESMPWVACLNKGLALGCIQTLTFCPKTFCPEKAGTPAVCENEGQADRADESIEDTKAHDTCPEEVKLPKSSNPNIAGILPGRVEPGTPSSKNTTPVSPGNQVTGVGARLCVIFEGLKTVADEEIGDEETPSRPNPSSKEALFREAFVRAVAKAGRISEDRVRVLEISKPLDAERPATTSKQAADTGGGVMMFLEPEDTADEAPNMNEDSGIRVLAVIREANTRGSEEERPSAMQALDTVHAELLDLSSAFHDDMKAFTEGRRGRPWGPDANNIRKQTPRAPSVQVSKESLLQEVTTVQRKSSQEPLSPAAKSI